ncbi:MAG: 2Fe-2S iron-sulfur cluster-binding protein, partial [Actinomycetota bacterium]|nr:2Fe-2S iron-sulfur cluster-binding protein [Actinomycetota bacterium]
MADEPNFVTFEIDGREVRAPEGMVLLDAARHYGDVEIPYFCYEAKLGKAVGACRMCMVEVEGMGTDISCSLTVEEGMVVSTTSPAVQRVQKAVVEFLLVNHPLDCPVCDKGGECPLQDISFGWGAGYSRFIEPKRHWKKPLELSPLIAIDRERCILCFRCTRFSQEVAEDYQLVFLERGDSTYVGTHDGRPYVAPFSGNVIELCPVGALTSSAYRFRARPWDVEEAGTVCTLCPSQCNVRFTIRDDNKVMRVLDRQNNEVDDGWLCDKGRFGYQAIHAPERIAAPMVKEAGALREVSWEQAMSEAVAGLERAGASTAALAGGQATNEEGFLLQRLMREALGSPHVDSRAGGPIDPEHARALARPDVSAKVSDIDAAGTVLVLGTELVDESPILDLRVRKAKRRGRVRIVVAGSRPGLLDPNADAIVRFAPGAEEAAIAALVRALGVAEPIEPPPPEVEPEDQAGPPDRRLLEEPFRAPEGGGSDDDALADLARRAGTSPESVERAAGLLRGSGPVVVLWGERLSHGRRGRQATAALLALARALDLPGIEGAGMIEVPAATNARGLREVGCLPNLLPGLEEAPSPGR